MFRFCNKKLETCSGYVDIIGIILHKAQDDLKQTSLRLLTIYFEPQEVGYENTV